MVRNGVLKLKAQIFCGSEFAIGPGKADLLESIDTEGSISAAGRALGMSYRRTWMLVETTAGGGASKGARLTPCGRAVLDAFRTLERELADTAARGSLDTLTALLLDMPRSPSAAAPPEN